MAVNHSYAHKKNVQSLSKLQNAEFPNTFEVEMLVQNPGTVFSNPITYEYTPYQPLTASRLP